MFRQHPVKFRTATATALARHSRSVQLERLAELCRHNAQALREALAYCAANTIGAFRVNSQILPLRTHPSVGYVIGDLPDGAAIQAAFEAAGEFARQHDIRLSFHPDQFVILNSPRADVVASSLAELDYQAEVAEWIGADAINIHGGGAYGDPEAALVRLGGAIERLPPRIRQRLTLENDDRTYAPADLLPVCRATGVPLVYDVHHHRCLPDALSVEEATHAALQTWNREPLFHISSPLNGWDGGDPRPHADMINPADIPAAWKPLRLTVDIEAKAKELALAAIIKW